MRKLATLAAAAALATAFGLAGMARAQTELLANGDAETGDLTGWSVSAGGPTADFNLDAIETGPIGNFAFDMGDTAVGAGGIASLTQRNWVDVSGCSLNVNDVDLLGGWSLSAFYVTETSSGDFGTISVEFLTSADGTLTFDEAPNLISPDDDNWVEVTDSGNVPLTATKAEVIISATEAEGLDAANVAWDEVSLEIDCVAANANISGTVGVRGDRKDPLYAFGGAVGTLEGGAVVGAITINYRDLGPTSCTFTPTEIDYTDDTSVAIVADYVCEGGDKDGDEGTDATINMTAKDAYHLCDEGDKKGRRNRGSIGVDSDDDDDLDISGVAGVLGGESCLATGNVIIAGPVED